MNADTIFARASGAGRAGVSVFRVSGPAAFEIAARLIVGTPPRARIASFRRFVDLRSGHTLDEGLAILFEGPASFTGEDVAEFHLHGSAAVEKDLYANLTSLGARPAEPGEFTRRALMNGRLDLAQVEGLGDLLDSETTRQREQALGQFGGRLSERAAEWRRRLLDALAFFAASIDFADEEDAPETAAAARAPIEALLAELRRSLVGATGARAVREGFRIALIGAPNVGKSSLLNVLAGDERAIVSEAPGTTRDVIEVRMDLGGNLASLVDTAGLRTKAADPVEIEGMRRSRAAATMADLRLILIAPVADVSRGTASVASVSEVSREALDLAQDGDVIVFTKADLSPSAPARLTLDLRLDGLSLVSISSVTGEGIETLTRLIGERIDAAAGAVGDAALTRERHVLAVRSGISCLERCLERMDAAPELAAEDARLAGRALGRIVGDVGVEDVLGEIFSRFCIGK